MMANIIDFAVKNWVLVVLFLGLALTVLLYELKTAQGGARKLTPQAAVLLINQQQAVVFDVRSKDIFKAGHIIDAVNVMPTEINEQSKKLNKYKSKPVILCDEMGHKVAPLASQLQKAGFNVHIMQGGVNAWQGASMPLVKG
jgi:rhodanese-related sulfurtransferase